MNCHPNLPQHPLVESSSRNFNPSKDHHHCSCFGAEIVLSPFIQQFRREFFAQLMQEAGYVWREGDVDWNPVTTLTYPAICSVAGLVAGMFGVGGGIVKISLFQPTLFTT